MILPQILPQTGGWGGMGATLRSHANHPKCGHARWLSKANHMPPSLNRSIADSIDAPVEALRWIDEVFADLAALGSSPRLIARWLADAGIGTRHAVLDLGCGKGAVAVEVAARLACRVVGVDAFKPFVQSAATLAAARNVSHLCQFQKADARRYPIAARHGPTPRFDAVLMVGLFDLEDAAAVLRPLVRPGGLYLIDDCVSPGRSPPTDDAPLTRSEARLLLEERGDRIERETMWTPSQVLRVESVLADQIARRVRAIIRREPAARVPLTEFLKRQRASASDLVGAVRPAMWLVRKRGSGSGRPANATRKRAV